MLDLNNIFDSNVEVSTGSFITVLLASLVVGTVIALEYSYKNKYTKSFITSLVLLPAIVSLVIIMVNGNIGTGVAVAGAFSLVRFRSAPGTAKEIAAIFEAMASGLSLGMGYIIYTIIFVLIISLASIMLKVFNFEHLKNINNYKTLRITIPEVLDYEGVFDKTLKKYCHKYDLLQVKTTNMGSMYKLIYDLEVKKNVSEKALIDELRTMNGNLEISMSIQSSSDERI